MTLTADTESSEAEREGLIEIDGEGFYAIPDIDHIPPFLMSVVSDGDHWMFVSSTGALTAGRTDVTRALFPYETDDRIHKAAGFVGPVTAMRIATPEGVVTWRPFHSSSNDATTRSLYKTVVGDSIIFEEAHHELALTFRYRWTTSDRFGFIRSATLVNRGDHPVRVEYVDGLVNLLPYGLEPLVYQRLSNLTNAYKRSEVVDAPTRLAVFSLESGVVDRPEPAEVLRGTAVWSVGLDDAVVTVIPDAISEFTSGGAPQAAHLSTGRPGAYLLTGSIALEPEETRSWYIVADVGQDQVALTGLRKLLQSEPNLPALLTTSIDRSSESLVEIMALADALQRTGDRVATAHQFANVTYNVMRGGVPLNGYRIGSADFARFLEHRNRHVADRHRDWLRALPDVIEREALLEEAHRANDPHLVRLSLEYLPFSFARRHGDPSRPWNAFSIRVRDAAGEPILYYEGNWRDIFQNWEALCMSFPEFLPSVISVFVDASTPDGYNPYRITRAGIDWEIPDPEDPWSHIGYWGDHQIVYLLRLLEASEQFLPGTVAGLLGERLFSYADVPYRLAPYEELVRDPKATIRYDEAAARRVFDRVDVVGGDGRLVWDEHGEVHLATLAEKLVVPALSKLSNLVPGGGIWMNTQRPEWNDANNALVGFGLSMVTLYELRRYLGHLQRLIEASPVEVVAVASEVTEWMRAVSEILRHSEPGRAEQSDELRKGFMDDLGKAFDDYRSQVYESGFSGIANVDVDEIARLCEAAIERLDATIRTNRRSDGLFHSYNLIRFTDDGSAAAVEHLYEMLEGQVAVLESGVLSADERVEVIDALFSSAMYRPDQHSLTLYPARRLPSFLDKNVVLPEAVTTNPLLSGMIDAGDRSIISVDADGRYRFNAEFSNRRDLDSVLDRLAGDDTWRDLVDAHRPATLDAYEQVFGHHGYTGRSGSMYGYEGIGSIYWHMVAKLLVAVQGSVLDAISEEASPATTQRLIDAYWRVRAGLGFNKTAEEFGAIPLDPYSHTPAHAGAQQPGMTGLVKEELLTRPLELGVRVEDGEIVVDPILLRRAELLDQRETWRVYDVAMESADIELDAGALGATLCQVPLVVSVTAGEPEVEITFSDGTTRRLDGLTVNREISAEVFARSGAVERIHARIPADALRGSPS